MLPTPNSTLRRSRRDRPTLTPAVCRLPSAVFSPWPQFVFKKFFFFAAAHARFSRVCVTCEIIMVCENRDFRFFGESREKNGFKSLNIKDMRNFMGNVRERMQFFFSDDSAHRP